MNERRPPDVPIILSWLGRLIYWLTGWKTEGYMPNVPRCVITASPHTSNQDGFMMVMASWIFRIRLNWVGKQELFRPPVAALLKAVGGLPIDRDSPRKALVGIIRAFREREHLILVMAPEGTREKTDRWKPGFYYIAKGAGVPVVLSYIDYQRKVVGIGPVVELSGDMEADLQIMQDFYRDKVARYPEKKTLPLGDEQTAP